MFWADRASWPQRTALSVESVESSGLWRRWGLLSRVWIWLRDVGSTGSTVTWLVVVEVVKTGCCGGGANPACGGIDG